MTTALYKKMDQLLNAAGPKVLVIPYMQRGATDTLFFGRNEPALAHFHRSLAAMLERQETARPTARPGARYGGG